MATSRKSFLLRLPPDLYHDLKGWAEQELRSVNAQIEFLLREAVRRRKGHSAGSGFESPKGGDSPSGDGESPTS